MLRYPCPACNADRPTSQAHCSECDWPHRDVVHLPELRQLERSPPQWSLRGLFCYSSLACCVFAIVGQCGIDGFLDRIWATLIVLLCFSPPIALFLWWRRIDSDLAPQFNRN